MSAHHHKRREFFLTFTEMHMKQAVVEDVCLLSLFLNIIIIIIFYYFTQPSFKIEV